MFDSNSSEDPTSGVVGGIGGGHRIIKTSWSGISPALLQLLTTLVGELASQSAPPSW
jgi:hypothetical protein